MIETNKDSILFTHMTSKFSVNTFSEFPLVDLWSYWGGNLVYTTLEDAIFADKLCTNVKKIFYLWDLDWHQQGFGFTMNKELMNRADRLICRCEDHAIKVQQYCGKKTEVLTEFNYKVLSE